jgi:transposase-like protein
VKILFDSDVVKERCNGCSQYCEHHIGKTSEGQPAFKCRICGRLTVWLGGDVEKVVTPGSPPVGV